MAMAASWLASTARHQFTDVMDAAVEGKPRFIHRRDGSEVVLVSREYYEQTKPVLKSILLNAGFAEDSETEFDDALQQARAAVAHAATPRTPRRGAAHDVHPRYGRRKPHAKEAP